MIKCVLIDGSYVDTSKVSFIGPTVESPACCSAKSISFVYIVDGYLMKVVRNIENKNEVISLRDQLIKECVVDL